MFSPRAKGSEPTRFLAPFDKDDGDLIIRSCDDVHFKVHKLILSKASPAFELMFTAPFSEKHDSIQTITLEEDAVTTSRFLRLSYPVDWLPIDDLEGVSALLDVCNKYQAHALTERLGRMELSNFLHTDPLRVYVLSCRANTWDVAQRAAYACLALPLETVIDSAVSELRHVSAPAYRSLLAYYNECRRTAALVLSCGTYKWLTSPCCWFEKNIHDASCVPSNKWYTYSPESRRVPARQWWADVITPAETYLAHQASPLRPRLAGRIGFPKRTDIPCDVCRKRYTDELLRFIIALEDEIEKQVKTVKFSRVG